MDIEKEFERLGLGRKPAPAKPVQQVEEKAPCIQYKIVQSHDIQELTDRVSENLAKGWKPQGGIAVACASPAPIALYRYVQALIKDPHC